VQHRDRWCVGADIRRNNRHFPGACGRGRKQCRHQVKLAHTMQKECRNKSRYLVCDD
jgi:hypothetical protein